MDCINFMILAEINANLLIYQSIMILKNQNL